MSDTPTKPQDIVIVLDGQPCKIVWNRGAMFRADEVGAWAESTAAGLGFAQAAKLLYAMLPADRRSRWPSPEAVADVMPDVKTTWDYLNQAMAQAGEEMDSKNVFGSTSGHGASSS